MYRMSFSTAKYLIYNCFMTQTEYGKVGGSLLVDSANSVEEAIRLIDMYKVRAEEGIQLFNSDTTRYTYIENRPEWWSR